MTTRRTEGRASRASLGHACETTLVVRQESSSILISRTSCVARCRNWDMPFRELIKRCCTRTLYESMSGYVNTAHACMKVPAYHLLNENVSLKMVHARF